MVIASMQSAKYDDSTQAYKLKIRNFTKYIDVDALKKVWRYDNY